MKAVQNGTPKTHNLREGLVRRRNLLSEISPNISLSTESKRRRKKYSTRSSLKSPVVASTSRYYLRSSLALCTPSPQSNTRQSLTKSILKSCKATPYRTPMLTSKINNLKLSDNKAWKAIWKHDIKALMDVSWKVCYLSSMTNFEYRNKNVRNIYEAVLRTKILAVGAFVNLSVKIETSSCLTQNPHEENALSITVTVSDPTDNEDEDIIVSVYTAWLIASKKCQSKRSAKVQWLPLMLYRGREAIHVVVTEWMQSSFGCFVTPKMLQQSTMLWISAVWSKERCLNKNHMGSNEKIYYKYYVRDRLQMGNKIEISLNFLRSDIMKIYDLMEDKYSEPTIPFVTEFHSTIQSFVSSITCLPSDFLRLQKLRSSCFSLDNHGNIKLLCYFKIPSLLNHLTELLKNMLICSSLSQPLSDSDSGDDDSDALVN